MQVDRIEYLIFMAGDAEPSIRSRTEEGAQLWAARHEQNTGTKVRLVRRTYTFSDTPLEVMSLEDVVSS